MLRSKSRDYRSGSIEFGQRSGSSIFSRTISASKFCRGDADFNSHQIVSKTKRLSEVPVKPLPSSKQDRNRIKRGGVMQQMKMGQVQEEELRELKEQLSKVEGERNRAVDELKKIQNLEREFGTLQEELNQKDKIIELLKQELEKSRGLEAKLVERDVGLGRLREELSNAKLREGHAKDLVADHQRKIHELDEEVESRKLCETRMFDLLASQTKKYEDNKMELEECKLENICLLKKIEILEASMKNSSSPFSSDGEDANLLKNELKMAMEAEEKSRKAMDDLAFALKEVATEASEAKKKCSIAELELNHLTETLKTTKENYDKLLEEAKKEAETHKNTVDRLRLEAEESLLAWNGKEIGFVECIKKAEEESAKAQEETKQVRDILKQAINEASVAKAAADIARDENTQLKDNLGEMEEALQFLSRENERLRISEAAANEKVEQLERLLSQDDKIHVKKKRGMKSPHSESDKSSEEEDEEIGNKKASKTQNDVAAEDVDPRRRRALFRKVGDLIMKRSFSINRKDPSPEPVPADKT